MTEASAREVLANAYERAGYRDEALAFRAGDWTCHDHPAFTAMEQYRAAGVAEAVERAAEIASQWARFQYDEACEVMAHAIADDIRASAQEAGGVIARDQFIGWIADRFQQAHVPPLDRAGALRMATANLEYNEAETMPFGHPDYDWSQDGAVSLADYEIDTCWETAS